MSEPTRRINARGRGAKPTLDFSPVFDRIRSLPPEERFRVATELHDEVTAARSEVGALRRSAIRELRLLGYTLRELAEMFGLTISRIQRLEDGADSQEDRRARARRERQHTT